MKKAKLRSGTAGSKGRPTARPGQPEAIDLAEIRRRITGLVSSGAVGMVENTIEEVGKGHYLGMKYLFEMIGLYPASPTEDTSTQDSMAATLMRRLGIPEAPMPEPAVTKESSASGADAGDGLE